jgi:hypothetical protein
VTSLTPYAPYKGHKLRVHYYYDIIAVLHLLVGRVVGATWVTRRGCHNRVSVQRT